MLDLRTSIGFSLSWNLLPLTPEVVWAMLTDDENGKVRGKGTT
jgi:hypothetical protein